MRTAGSACVPTIALFITPMFVRRIGVIASSRRDPSLPLPGSWLSVALSVPSTWRHDEADANLESHHRSAA